MLTKTKLELKSYIDSDYRTVTETFGDGRPDFQHTAVYAFQSLRPPKRPTLEAIY